MMVKHVEASMILSLFLFLKKKQNNQTNQNK